MKKRLSEEDRIQEIARACACNTLRRASRAMTSFFDEQMRSSGVRVTQCPLLVALYLVDARGRKRGKDAGSLTIADMARHLGMDRTTLTRNLNPLQELGYARVAVGDDQRTRHVSITPAGRVALLAALPLWQQTQRMVVEKFGAPSFDRLIENLHLIAAQVANET